VEGCGLLVVAIGEGELDLMAEWRVLEYLTQIRRGRGSSQLPLIKFLVAIITLFRSIPVFCGTDNIM
jgi:hypothetical protein